MNVARAITTVLSSPLAGGGLPSPSLLQQALLLSSGPTIDGLIVGEEPGRGTQRAMQPGRAVKFDGVNDYINCPPGVIGVDNFSVSVWANYPSVSGSISVFGAGNPYDTGGYGIIGYNQDGVMRLMMRTGGAIPTPNVSGFTAGIWHHLCFIVDRVNQVATVYVDGVPGTPLNISAITGTLAGARFDLGKYGNLGSYYAAGELSDFQILPKALSESEVQQLYQLGSSALPNEPRTAWYKLDEQHPTIAYDSSGNGNHGTLTNVNATVGNFFYEGADVPHSYQNDKGYVVGSIYNRTAGTAWAAGICRADEIVGDISFKYVIMEGPLNRNEYVGFDTGVLSSQTSIDLAYYYRSVGFSAIYESGTAKLQHDLVIGDVLEFRKVGTVVTVYKNGSLLYTSEIVWPETVRIVRFTYDKVTYANIVVVPSGVPWVVTGGTIEPVTIPRDESSKLQDVFGNDLQYTGRCPRNAQLVQSNCLTFDGVDDYLDIPSLVGTETVVSSGGTSTPSIAAGQINFTAGTCWDLLLSNGSHYPMAEGAGDKCYDVGPNGSHGTVTNADLVACWAGKQNEYHRNAAKGHTKYTHATLNPLYVPYDAAGEPISVVPPSGYTKVTDYPAGAWHNMAESRIDFTQGVGSPGSAGLPTAFDPLPEPTNPLFRRLRTKSSANVAADRIVRYSEVLTGDRLLGVQKFTETKEV